MVEFKDKTALITGGGSGIGEAIALQFASRGTNLILTGRRRDALERVAGKCRSYGVCADIFTADLSDRESTDKLTEHIRNNFSKIEFFVLNAGVSQRALTLETDIEIDRKIMEVNYFSGVYLIKSLKDMILSSGTVRIAVVSSISGLFGFPLRSAYCASKHALHGFYETLSIEYPQIKVTLLVPGRIRTEISRSALLASGEKFDKMDPGQANGMSVEKCAAVALKAIEKGKRQQLIGGKELLMVYIYKYCPKLFFFLAGRISAH